MLAVDVSEFGENFLFPFVVGIELPEIGTQFFVGTGRQIHFPDALVIAEEREDWRGAFDARFERSAGECESAAL